MFSARPKSSICSARSRARPRRRTRRPLGGETTFRPREKVTVYDFKRPERVGKEQMRSLQTMHEGFGRNFGAALSALLRTMVEVKLTSVDQLTYSEFVFSLENPTCFNLISAAPLEGQLILDINPSILFPDDRPPARRQHQRGPAGAPAADRNRAAARRRASRRCFSRRCSTRGKTCSSSSSRSIASKVTRSSCRSSPPTR